MNNKQKFSEAVSDKVFKSIYDSSASLPSPHKWVTRDLGVREIVKLFGVSSENIGATCHRNKPSMRKHLGTSLIPGNSEASARR